MTKREAISIGIGRLMHGDSVNSVSDFLSLEFELYAKQQAIAFTKHYLQSAIKDNRGIATDAGPNDRLEARYDYFIETQFIEQQNKDNGSI